MRNSLIIISLFSGLLIAQPTFSAADIDGGADGECFEHTFTPEQVREFKKRYVTALRTSSDLWEEDALFDMTK